MFNIINISSNSLSYLSGTITIGPFGTYSVSDIDTFNVANDPYIRRDLSSNIIQLFDSASNFGTNDAIIFLDRIIGNKDMNGIGITSTGILTKNGLDVNVINTITTTPSIYKLMNIYNEVDSVVNGVETDITTYTVPAGKKARLYLVNVSGTNISEYTIYVNTIAISKKRTMFGSSFNCDFYFANDGVILTSNDVVTIKVLHARPNLGEFNSNIQVNEEI